MNIPPEKIAAAIAALHRAEAALLASDTEANCVIAGECAVAAVYLETSVKIAGEAVHHVRITGEVH
jgi:hypothetical protein